jgi:hypothetical protein
MLKQSRLSEQLLQTGVQNAHGNAKLVEELLQWTSDTLSKLSAMNGVAIPDDLKNADKKLKEHLVLCLSIFFLYHWFKHRSSLMTVTAVSRSISLPRVFGDLSPPTLTSLPQPSLHSSTPFTPFLNSLALDLLPIQIIPSHAQYIHLRAPLIMELAYWLQEFKFMRSENLRKFQFFLHSLLSLVFVKFQQGVGHFTKTLSSLLTRINCAK